MRSFTYLMGVAALAAASLVTGCSDDAGEDVAEAGGTGGGAGSAGSAGNAGSAGDGGSGGAAGDGMGGSAGMENMAGSGGMGVGNGSGDADAGLDAGSGADAAADSGVDAGQEVTAQSQFSPIYQSVFTRCAGCHNYGNLDEGISFMNVTMRIDTVLNRLQGIGGAIMPQGCGNGGNAACLSANEIATIEAWVDDGMPR